MTKILDSLPDPRSVASSYPFQEWADGEARLLVRGTDYAGTDQSMIRQLRRAAARRGQSVHVRRVDDGLAIQFV